MASARELLALNMKKARLRLGYSQMKLSEKVGCSTSLIGDIEICRKFPSAENLDRIAVALALQTSELFCQPEAVARPNGKDDLASLMAKLKESINDDIEVILSEYMKAY